MKRTPVTKIFACSLVVLLAFSFASCNPDPDPEPAVTTDSPDNENESSSGNPSEQGSSTIPTSGVVSDSYFWGTWIRMDNGKEYKFAERYVAVGKRYFENLSSNSSSLSVKSLGSFERQSDAVMLLDAVPLFRKGGANIDYTVKLVGFADTTRAARAAISSNGVGGLRVQSSSENYPSHKSEAVSDSDGNVRLKAPVAGDSETIVVTSGNTTYLATGLQVNTRGSNMGTIPIVGENDCSLKVTGKIPDSETQGGYLYANKQYGGMEIMIENIGDADCTSAHVTVTPLNPEFLTISGDTDFNVSTLKPGKSKKQSIDIDFGTFSEPYRDTGLNVRIELSDENERTWEDFIPLRVFRGQMPVTIAAKSTEGNANSKLNGFLIYPDGNNKFFSIPHDGEGTLYVPTFKASESLMLVFSGATSSGELATSTEMFYTVAVDSSVAEDIVTTGDNVRSYMRFGESGGGNETENSAFVIDSSNTSFEAYLKDSDRDFYKISVESDSVSYYGAESYYSLSYENVTHNSATLSWSLTSGVQENNVCLYKDGTLVASGVASPYTVSNLSGNTKYTFVLKSPENDEISPSVTFRTKETPSLSLSYTGVTDTTVTLSLVNISGSDATVCIFKDGAYCMSHTISAGSENSFVTVSGLKKGTSYTFVVKESESASSADISNSVTVQTSKIPPVVGKPVIDEVSADGKYDYYGRACWSYVYFKWKPCTSGATKYKIYHWSDSTSTITAESIVRRGTLYTTTTSLSYKDTGSRVDGVSLEYIHNYAIVPVDYDGNAKVENATVLRVYYNNGFYYSAE